jgi:predicted nuclease with TOPRIM domain
MVDKKNPKEPDGSDLVQQNFELKQHVDNLEKLETRIMLFDEKLSLLAKEMIDMKNRQEELIQIIKQGLR